MKSLNLKTDPLLTTLYSAVTKNFIDDDIKRLCDLINKIHGVPSDTETVYESAGEHPQSAPALLRVLRRVRKGVSEDGIM